MDFLNNKKTFLAKLDRSKKGDIDELLLPLIKLINSKEDYFTTSSCSGRIFLWQSSSGKKNELVRLKVSHDLIDLSFFDELNQEKGLVWLRLEPFILHVCCRDLDSANLLLSKTKLLFKKSSLFSISNKIIVEIKGSEFIEHLLLKDGVFLFKDNPLLIEQINLKLSQVHQDIVKLYQKLKNK